MRAEDFIARGWLLAKGVLRESQRRWIAWVIAKAAMNQSTTARAYRQRARIQPVLITVRIIRVAPRSRLPEPRDA